ncbi:MAG: hypothetical protein RQ899_15685, partial [Pseudomonadales bacterium]|nr:hypothetical protein [Pseudomonadales bacterium]
ALISLVMLLALSACSTQTVKTTSVTPMLTGNTGIPEEQLLDVGIGIFDPGLDEVDKSRKELTFADVRHAETFYVSHLLSKTLQSNGSWGVVRVVPGNLESSDVAVNGTILQSDGEAMKMRVKVSDASGRVWYEKEYEEVVSKYSYDPKLRRNEDSFQGLYNRIANDMLQYRQKNMNPEKIASIRTIAQLQFAKGFAPEVFDEYLAENRQGIIRIKRLPATNDPMLARIQGIRERDNMYIDTLQDYYSNFAREMEQPYTEFRRLSYEEVMKLDRIQADARRNMFLGVAAILGGLVATQSSSNAVVYSSIGALGAGGFLIKDAFNKNAEAQMRLEQIAELGSSLEQEIAPQTIELEERTVTLSGSVEEQYAQWREILADIYANEIGEEPSNSF